MRQLFFIILVKYAFEKKNSSAHQGYIPLIENTVKQ